MPRRKKKADAPPGWKPCMIPECDNFVSPRFNSKICYNCRNCMRYHTKQGPIHCVLYAAKIEKLHARARIFTPKSRKRKVS